MIHVLRHFNRLHGLHSNNCYSVYQLKHHNQSRYRRRFIIFKIVV